MKKNNNLNRNIRALRRVERKYWSGKVDLAKLLRVKHVFAGGPVNKRELDALF